MRANCCSNETAACPKTETAPIPGIGSVASTTAIQNPEFRILSYVNRVSVSKEKNRVRRLGRKIISLVLECMQVRHRGQRDRLRLLNCASRR